MKKNNQTHHHYAIRKFTVGAGSTLIASFIVMGLSTSAHAEESTQTHHETQVEAEHTQENEQLLPSKDIMTAQQVETQPDISTKRSETQTSHVNTPSSEKNIQEQNTTNLEQEASSSQIHEGSQTKQEKPNHSEPLKPKQYEQPAPVDNDSVTNYEEQKVTEDVIQQVEAPVPHTESLKTNKAQQAINQYPVIFVHGFMGFTGEIKPDLYPNYWGGDKYRVIDGLREKGYEAYEASVGAFSSNYDRAIELYYYIKGGTVDYGAAHAEKYGHSRYGRTYAGVFHEWAPGKKVHMVGHSMGGQTIRLLEHFLRFGNQEEIDYQRQHGGTISSLFEGGKDHMIASITTLGTPHNGSAAADRIGNEKAFKDIVYALGRMGGGKLANIDFGFEKWGFKQRENESYIEYAQRVAQSKLWDTDDNAMYDLTSEGSEKLNQMTPMNPNIVYTTYTGLASHEGLTGNHIPDIGQFFLFDSTSRVIGSEENQALRPNDGIVSVVSSLYPTGQDFTEFTDGLKKGIWQVTPVMKGWDHLDFVGLDTLDFKHTGQELQGFYAGLINHMMRIEELDI
ncbi:MULTISPECIES: YSIRK-targeted triacylglycerol lipase [Staphylococcus]|uniref:YSIRK-targeted triacylglycerol lipase n=3 Tax=Staphylococcus TaxID=1279 RepID=UPI000763F12F|nr:MULTISPECIES: YSIRK-type signal peptide-containing protein [Staphylococcus]KXA41730.1 putative triacylglycerol lipase [Staphylococcus simulans]OFN23188.1 hypothetical protein HMPREF2603_09630 [Staphylococcus sp. HMSC055C03]OFU81173.1 hypothetical protein HMPREF3110_00475 [Staphylococcus sp. HMSC10C03]OFV07365.1 hypothetical protein HMPREF3124_03545 [Staphylococcus sp. HMSC12H08]OHR52573.1 hypothetical protein HMPREF3021_04565 [Staphylococcus sp. HMSC070A02]